MNSIRNTLKYDDLGFEVRWTIWLDSICAIKLTKKVSGFFRQNIRPSVTVYVGSTYFTFNCLTDESALELYENFVKQSARFKERNLYDV